MSDTPDSAAVARPADEPVAAWEDPPRDDRTAGAPILAVDGFEGPLDWWLEMARAQKIDLAKLSIAALIGAFAAALEAALPSLAGSVPSRACLVARRIDGQLARWAGWTVMAATLTELRSRLLLPPDAPLARAAAAQAEALRRLLLDRSRMRGAADWLEHRAQLGHDAFRRGQPELSAAGRHGDLTELLRACLPLLQVPQHQAAALRPRPPPLWTAGDAMRQFARLLPERPDGCPLTAFLPTIPSDAPGRARRCRVAVATTLLAGLELARDGTVMLDQAADWMPIHVTSRVNREAVADDTESPA
jgi:segregation and condensation protein A